MKKNTPLTTLIFILLSFFFIWVSFTQADDDEYEDDYKRTTIQKHITEDDEWEAQIQEIINTSVVKKTENTRVIPSQESLKVNIPQVTPSVQTKQVNPTVQTKQVSSSAPKKAMTYTQKTENIYTPLSLFTAANGKVFTLAKDDTTGKYFFLENNTLSKNQFSLKNQLIAYLNAKNIGESTHNSSFETALPQSNSPEYAQAVAKAEMEVAKIYANSQKRAFAFERPLVPTKYSQVEVATTANNITTNKAKIAAKKLPVKNPVSVTAPKQVATPKPVTKAVVKKVTPVVQAKPTPSKVPTPTPIKAVSVSPTPAPKTTLKTTIALPDPTPTPAPVVNLPRPSTNTRAS